jgi:PAS domain S-box-containing protein
VTAAHDAGGSLDVDLTAAPEESAEDLYEHAPCGYLSTRLDGTIVRVNQTFLDWTGLERAELVGRRRFQDLLTPGGRIYHETHYAPLLRMQDAVREIALDLECAGDRRLPVLVNATVRRDADGRAALVRTTVFNATDRKRYERELVAAKDRERAARRRVERLQRITARLAATLSMEEIAEAATGELVGAAGVDRAALLLVEPDATGLTVLGARGLAPAEAAAWARPGGLAAEALARGRAVYADGPHAALPLVVDDHAIGAIAIGRDAAGAIADEERTLLEAFAGQCAGALERARLLERSRGIAHVLQTSMLAGKPPADARVSLATRYLPGMEHLEVGGDWYDAFPLGPDRLAIAVGDVVGRGVEAASAMGQLRSAVRALAVAEHAPARLLERLDGFVEHVEAGRFATVVYGDLDLASGRLRYACAGHPPPLLAPSGGASRFLWDGRSAPLGAYVGHVQRDQAELTLPHGARLVLYTDGLVERRGEALDAGLDRLAGELERRRGASLPALATSLADAMLHGQAAHDDVCLLALELHAA